MTGAARVAAAELAHAQVFIVGSPRPVPVEVGDSEGRWALRIGVSGNGAAEIRAKADMWSPFWPLTLHLALWADSRDAAERVQAAATAALANVQGRGAWLHVAPEVAAQAVRAAADGLGVALFDDAERWVRIEAKVQETIARRVGLGGRR